MATEKNEQFTEQETMQRMEAAIRRAQSMPHKPNAKLTAKRRKSPKSIKRRPATPKSA